MRGAHPATPPASARMLSWLRTALIVATFPSFGVIVMRVLRGAGPFERMGIGWGHIIVIYYVGFTLGGFVVGILQPLRRYAWGAALLGFLFVFPMYVGISVLIGLGLKHAPSLAVGLVIGVILSAFVGGALGVSWWIDDHNETGNDKGLT